MRSPGPSFEIDPEVESLVNLEPYDPASYGSPPGWALRASLINTGTRVPRHDEFKRKPVWQGVYTEDADDYSSGDWTPFGRPVGFVPNSAIAAALSRRERRKARQDEKRACKDIVPAGNLNESDYQFWRGSAAKEYKAAYCRWCERGFYNKQDRQQHFRKEGECSHKIRTVQNWAAATRLARCFTCNKETYHKRWGFPLCDSVACLGVWKFAGNAQHIGWTEYRSEALKAGILRQAGYEK